MCTCTCSFGYFLPDYNSCGPLSQQTSTSLTDYEKSPVNPLEEYLKEFESTQLHLNPSPLHTHAQDTLTATTPVLNQQISKPTCNVEQNSTGLQNIHACTNGFNVDFSCMLLYLKSKERRKEVPKFPGRNSSHVNDNNERISAMFSCSTWPVSSASTQIHPTKRGSSWPSNYTFQSRRFQTGSRTEELNRGNWSCQKTRQEINVAVHRIKPLWLHITGLSRLDPRPCPTPTRLLWHLVRIHMLFPITHPSPTITLCIIRITHPRWTQVL